MKKIIIITVILFLLFLTTGLKDYIGGRNDAENLFIITSVGIDEGRSEDDVKVTIISKETGSGEDQVKKEEEQKFFLSEGSTLFEANRKFTAFMKKDLFWGHLDNIIISEAVAKDQLPNYLDELITSHEAPLDPHVFIVKGATAEDVIKTVTESKEDVTDLLNSLLSAVGAISITSEVNLLQAANLIMNKYSATYIPLIEIQEQETTEKSSGENEEQKSEESKQEDSKQEDSKQEESKKFELLLDGYAIFDQENYELVGFLEDAKARGFNWIMDEIFSGTIIVKDPKGAKIALEIIESKPKIEPEITGDEITVTLAVKMHSNIAEQQGDSDIGNKPDLENLNNQQKEIIQKEIQSVLDFGMEHNIDMFNISSAINHKYPVKWEEEIKDIWREKISTINYQIEVDSSIKTVYTIQSPIISEEKEKEK